MKLRNMSCARRGLVVLMQCVQNVCVVDTHPAKSVASCGFSVTVRFTKLTTVAVVFLCTHPAHVWQAGPPRPPEHRM